MFPMPIPNRDEACEEIRQHLEALIEDYQGEGCPPQEAVTLAVERFGSPFKLGRKIGCKWEANRKRQIAAANPVLARQRKWMRFLCFCTTGIGMLLIMRFIDGWLPLVICCAALGILIGCLFPSVPGISEQLYDRLGMGQEEAQGPSWEAQMKMLKRLSLSRSLRIRTIVLISQWVITYSHSRGNNPTKLGLLSGNAVFPVLPVLLLVGCIAFNYWPPVDHDVLINRKIIIFMLVTLPAQDIGRGLINRWIQSRTA